MSRVAEILFCRYRRPGGTHHFLGNTKEECSNRRAILGYPCEASATSDNWLIGPGNSPRLLMTLQLANLPLVLWKQRTNSYLTNKGGSYDRSNTYLIRREDQSRAVGAGADADGNRDPQAGTAYRGRSSHHRDAGV